MMRHIKLAVFSLLPVLLLLLAAESAAFLFGLGRPSHSIAKTQGFTLAHLVPDRELGWSLRPGWQGIGQGGELVNTNSHGLRSPEIRPKKEGEYRILSLGESSTFGVQVPRPDTYSAQLERILNESVLSRSFTVINAGVSAYTSTQSLLYLKSRGLRLKPDMVLFYHEVNDYLPTVIRQQDQTEVGILMTDRQLYGSRLHRIKNLLMEKSHFFRFLTLYTSGRKLFTLRRSSVENPLPQIGLPVIITPREEHLAAELKVSTFGRRVSDAERLKNFEELSDLCRREGIALVVIHPAYRDTKPHKCLLTHFCAERGVLMFEAYDAVTAPFASPLMTYADSWHPSALGHRQIATGLADFITARVFFAPPQ